MQGFEPAKLSRQVITSCFVVAALAFLVVNLVVGKTVGASEGRICRELFSEKEYHQPGYGSWAWWLTKEYVDAKTPADVVVLGSSQINTAVLATDAHESQQVIDTLTHREINSLEKRLNKTVGDGHLKVFNAAIAGAVASDYYMVAKALFGGYSKPKLVVIGVSPRDFIDNELPVASATAPFHYYSQFVDTGKMTQLAYPDPIARLNAQLAMTFDKLPLRQVHSIIDTYLLGQKKDEPKKHSESALLAAVSNAAQVVKPGEWMIPANMPPIYVDNSYEYVKRYRDPNPPNYPIQLAFFDELLSWLAKENVKVLVVGMPTRPENRQLLPPAFWSTYRLTLNNLCQRNGAYFIDVSHCNDFEKCDFVDTVHMNASGGAKILDVFAEGIVKRQDLLAAIKQDASIASRP